LRKQRLLRRYPSAEASAIELSDSRSSRKLDSAADTIGIVSHEASQVLTDTLIEQLRTQGSVIGDLTRRDAAHEDPNVLNPVVIARERTLSAVFREEMLEIINDVVEGDNSAQPQFAENPMATVNAAKPAQLRTPRISAVQLRPMSMRTRERHVEKTSVPQQLHRVIHNLQSVLPAAVLQEAISLAIHVSGAAEMTQEDLQRLESSGTTRPKSVGLRGTNGDDPNKRIQAIEAVLHATLTAAVQGRPRNATAVDLLSDIELMHTMKNAAIQAKLDFDNPEAPSVKQTSSNEKMTFFMYLCGSCTCIRG
jgi:hypothetical protein